MKKRNRIWTILLVLAMLLILSSAILVYVRQLTKATDTSVVASMQELSRHDMQNIQSVLDNSWDSLSAIYDRTQVNHYDQIQDVCSRLSIEQISNIYDSIYLVDSDGNTYSSTNLVKNERTEKYVQPLFLNQKKFVMRYDNLGKLETMTENLVYGVQGKPFKVGNIEFIGIIGFSNVSLMTNHLKIDSFDGRGYTTVIDIDGNFVVNRDRTAGIGKPDNYFDQLKKNAGLSKPEISSIITKLTEKKQFMQYFDFADQGEQVVSFIPMPGTSWSILLSVPQEVFREQTQQFVYMTGIMLVIVVIVLCLMMLIIIRISLISATAKAEAKSRGDFLSSMSHEIRTPLNGIIGLNHLMQQNTHNPDKLMEYLKKSDSTAQYLLFLVNDILDMSKLQSYKMVLVPKPFSVADLISTIESMMRDRMEDKGINFSVETSLVCPDLIGDDIRIEQILVNILGNAAKFTPEGGRVIMRVFQTVKGDKVLTTYQVEDTGCGISEAFQKKIFEPFSQEREGISQGRQGTGLGMSISSMLAKQMDGTLTVSSRLGEGSCFTFAMLSEKAKGITNNKIPADPNQRVSDHGKRLHILVAEDNALNAEILTEILAESDFITSLARDGGEVIELFEKSALFEFDVILMDVQMPIRDGFEAAKLIRNLERPDAKSVIIYACTANTFIEYQEKAQAVGMNGFITKPIDVNKLIKKLGMKN